MDCGPLGSSVHEILTDKNTGWVSVSFSRESSQLRDPTCVSCISRHILYTEPPGVSNMVPSEEPQVSVQFGSVQSLSSVQLCDSITTATHQASLSITKSQSPLKPMSIKSVMPSSHHILCRPLLLLPSIFPSIRVISNESVLCISWPKYWSFSFSTSLSIQWIFRTDLL